MTTNFAELWLENYEQQDDDLEIFEMPDNLWAVRTIGDQELLSPPIANYATAIQVATELAAERGVCFIPPENL